MNLPSLVWQAIQTTSLATSAGSVYVPQYPLLRFVHLLWLCFYLMASLVKAPLDSRLPPSCHHQTGMQWNGQAVIIHCVVWRLRAIKVFGYNNAMPCVSTLLQGSAAHKVGMWIGFDRTNQSQTNIHRPHLGKDIILFRITPALAIRKNLTIDQHCGTQGCFFSPTNLPHF